MDTEKRKISTVQVAEALGIAPQAVRLMLQRGLLPFGIAFKKDKDSSTWTYVIYPKKFEEYCG